MQRSSTSFIQEMVEPKNVILHPNWNLLDSTFDSYKLSLQQLPVYTVTPHCTPDTVFSGDEISYNRTKAVSMHNYLFGDPWNSHTCYFVDDTGKIRCITAIVQMPVAPPHQVFQLGSHFQQKSGRMPVTVSFPSSTLGVICDGAGLFYLVDTGNRENNNGESKWKVLLEQEMIGGAQSPAMLLHSRYFRSSHLEAGDCRVTDVIGVLSLQFQDGNRDTSVSSIAVLNWTTLGRPEGEAKYRVHDRHAIKGKRSPFYACLGDSVNEIFLGCQSKLKFESDWDQQTLDEEMDSEKTQNVYTWSQTSQLITVWATLPDALDKISVMYSLSETEIKVGFKSSSGDEIVVLAGQLFHKADKESSKWLITENTLEVTIEKKEKLMWPYIVLGDTKGMLCEDGETETEMPNVDARGMQPSGLESYEECDDLPHVDSSIYRFSSVSGKFTHKASIASHQWLFNCYYDENLCFVLRHDIDALVWQSKCPTEACESPWTHAATFNALGYVRASKEDIKYGGCSATASYSALCESSRRVFVYHSPTSSAAPLRNRSTGKQLHISKQQVVTLPCSDPILGFHVAAEMMFILTEQKIFLVKVNTPDS